ncbi:hypothetical protein CERZMDRAFT_102999 [Cercospora zeae-maydis SCOH1-5]|uniref:Uncharacterized protein n=1 Tax=Cercospora zeae-maydis SCOH1-5 TaxID=717836 RepID=A0A6A6F2S2_9PEZI|nr:hypothetical protein CERZMDRAFT_102999 [Cercospora zeae-maydis SCOH1-5]
MCFAESEMVHARLDITRAHGAQTRHLPRPDVACHWTCGGRISPSCDPFCFFNSATDVTSLVSEISEIPEAVLHDSEQCKTCSDEEKMPWMANRRTTRVEDLAYCLLGRFEVFMPLVYGEGDKSQHRLLKEILAKKEAEQPRPEPLQDDDKLFGFRNRFATLA